MKQRDIACPSCGDQVRTGVAYCTTCGTSVTGRGDPVEHTAFVPLEYSPVPRRKQRQPRDHGWQFWRPRHFSLK